MKILTKKQLETVKSNFQDGLNTRNKHLINENIRAALKSSRRYKATTIGKRGNHTKKLKFLMKKYTLIYRSKFSVGIEQPAIPQIINTHLIETCYKDILKFLGEQGIAFMYNATGLVIEPSRRETRAINSSYNDDGVFDDLEWTP
jgi:hypothetical protein